MLKFLINYQHDDIPDFERNPRLLSFANGLLDVKTMLFEPYTNMSIKIADTHVARNHIQADYTGCHDTPLLDLILDAQFTSEVAELLCAMLGRLLFPVGDLDNWQVMPYLVGVGGTGKSLLLTIVSKLMAPGSVGNLSSKREEVFGLARSCGTLLNAASTISLHPRPDTLTSNILSHLPLPSCTSSLHVVPAQNHAPDCALPTTASDCHGSPHTPTLPRLVPPPAS